MNRETLIKKLKDIKGYLSEKASYYGSDSKWSEDVKAIQIAISIVNGNTQDIETRERLKEIERKIKSIQFCISLVSTTNVIAMATILFIISRR